MRLSELTALAPSEDAAARYRRDGCLLVRGALDRPFADDLRTQAVAVLREWGILAPQPEPRWNGSPVGARDFVELEATPAVARLVDGFATPGAPLRATVDRVCGGPMHLWRNACFFTGIPDDPCYVTKPHQDGYAMSGTGDYRRVWVALTHIPFGDGGLGLALGSHRAGRLPERDFPALRVRPNPDGPGGARPVRGVDPELVGDHWHTAELRPGDALIFHTDLVHRGLPPTSDRIRLALAAVASGADDPRPPTTFTKVELRARNRRLRDLGAALGLSADQVTAAGRDLVMTATPVDEHTVAAAAAGDYAGWRATP